jgi:diguanylate cyclase (GGDEF)-like protein
MFSIVRLTAEGGKGTAAAFREYGWIGGDEAEAAMREILELCTRMDELASRTYTSMAVACEDAQVAAVMRTMATEETAHVEWWTELLSAWDSGLLPDIFSNSLEATTQVLEIIESLEAAAPASGRPLTGDECLTAAVSMEFFMLDPMFGELLDLAEPAVARARHDAYSSHIERLIAAVEAYYRGETMAGFLARVLRRSWRENRRLAAYAMRDPLTGLSNRRAFGAQLRQWSAWSARYGRPLTVALLDIDDFKRVNDEHGHAAGDAMLTAIAQAIAGAVRASDMAARYGGDEFAVLAPETGPDDARRLTERVLEAIRKAEIVADDGARIHTTASIGLTVMLDPADSEPRRSDELLACADQGLYAAKQAGRDRASDPILLMREL